MRQIAYKLAVDCALVKSQLPDNHVVEWTYVDLHKEGDLSETEWKFLPENEFQSLLNNTTEEKVLEWKAAKDAAIKAELDAVAVKIFAENEAKAEQEDEWKAEFEAFKAWKASQ